MASGNLAIVAMHDLFAHVVFNAGAKNKKRYEGRGEKSPKKTRKKNEKFH